MLNLIFSIDDDKVTQMLNQMIFNRTAFAKKCLAFMNGAEAINYFQQLNERDASLDNVPALIFLDLNMPVMGGWQFLNKMEEEVIQRFPGIKIVISSSCLNPIEKKQADGNSNVIAFLNKPLTLDMINTLKHHPELKMNFGVCDKYNLTQRKFADSI